MIESRYVPTKCGEPVGYFNRPSVEYTGHGNDLICFGWNGRYFRASEDWVRNGCDIIIRKCNGTYDSEDGEGEPVGVKDLENVWGLCGDDPSYIFGWSPSEEYPYPCFTFEWLKEGSYLYDVFKEPVLFVGIPNEAMPTEYYMEV